MSSPPREASSTACNSERAASIKEGRHPPRTLADNSTIGGFLFQCAPPPREKKSYLPLHGRQREQRETMDQIELLRPPCQPYSPQPGKIGTIEAWTSNQSRNGKLSNFSGRFSPNPYHCLRLPPSTGVETCTIKIPAPPLKHVFSADPAAGDGSTLLDALRNGVSRQRMNPVHQTQIRFHSTTRGHFCHRHRTRRRVNKNCWKAVREG